jgi:hypothetical protein
MADQNREVDFSRSQLQDLAKRNGIKANLKSADIYNALNDKGLLPSVAQTNPLENKDSISTTEGKRNPPAKSASNRRSTRDETKDDKDAEDADADAAKTQALLLDTLDAFDVEELDQERLKEELANRGLSIAGDFEVHFLHRISYCLLRSALGIRPLIDASVVSS